MAGHVLRQMEDRPANVATNWIPEDGKRPTGTLQKTWYTTFTEDLQGFGITWRGAKRITNDHQEMEESCRPMFQWELEELSLNKYVGVDSLNHFPFRVQRHKQVQLKTLPAPQ